jgi:hypothetical protein
VPRPGLGQRTATLCGEPALAVLAELTTPGRDQGGVQALAPQSGTDFAVGAAVVGFTDDAGLVLGSETTAGRAGGGLEGAVPAPAGTVSAALRSPLTGQGRAARSSVVDRGHPSALEAQALAGQCLAHAGKKGARLLRRPAVSYGASAKPARTYVFTAFAV